jgi:predicted dehydrogenase
MWTRTFPIMKKVRELLKSGEIGEVVSVQADFGFRDRGIPRLSKPELGGGALLDIGVYVIAFASMILGPSKPHSIKSTAHVNHDKIDLTSSLLLSYGNENQKVAYLHCTIEAETSKTAVVWGTNGSIHIHKPFWCPEKMTIKKPGHDDAEIHLAYVKWIFFFSVS